MDLYVACFACYFQIVICLDVCAVFLALLPGGTIMKAASYNSMDIARMFWGWLWIKNHFGPGEPVDLTSSEMAYLVRAQHGGRREFVKHFGDLAEVQVFNQYTQRPACAAVVDYYACCFMEV